MKQALAVAAAGQLTQWKQLVGPPFQGEIEHPPPGPWPM